MKKLFFFFMLTIIMVSCSSEDDLLFKEPAAVSTTEGCKISVKEAVNRARKAVGECGSVATRSGAKARVDVIRSKALTRGDGGDTEMPDTLLYVVNFENNGGFAVIGADERVLPLYAVSDSGELNITEENNEALKLIMEGIEEDAAQRINQVLPIDPGTSPDIPGTSHRFPNHYYGWETSSTVGPHLSKFQNRTNYYGEYSKYIFMPDGRPTYSGCGAVALEQLLSFYKWPESIDGYDIDWDRIDREQDVDAVAKILYLLGQKEYLNMRYNVDSNKQAHVGYVSNSDEYHALLNLGYYCDSFINFISNEESVLETLRKKPLMFSAWAYVPQDTNINGTGHLWIIDGWKCYKWVTPGIPDENGLIFNNYELDPKGYLYHCVWGDLDGDCNGFYYIKEVNGFRGFYGDPDEFWNRDPKTTNGTQWHNHNSRIQFLNNVQPLK